VSFKGAAVRLEQKREGEFLTPDYPDLISTFIEIQTENNLR
jgi:hypothetical protein